MTLDEALKKLGMMTTMISIRAGADALRYGGAKPAKRWQVVASMVPGEVYPLAAEDDDLMVAVNGVIQLIEDRKTAARALADQYPAARELPEAKIDYIYPPAVVPGNGNGVVPAKIFGVNP